MAPLGMEPERRDVNVAYSPYPSPRPGVDGARPLRHRLTGATSATCPPAPPCGFARALPTPPPGPQTRDQCASRGMVQMKG